VHLIYHLWLNWFLHFLCVFCAFHLVLPFFCRTLVLNAVTGSDAEGAAKIKAKIAQLQNGTARGN
jgi:hypothetical protein